MSTPHRMFLALGIALLWSGAGACAAQVAAVWAVNDGEKIKRDDLDNPNKAVNSAWDGRKISLFAARNEVVAFQVVVQAGPQGAKDVDVTLETLVRGGGNEKLVLRPEGEDPTDWRGGHIERFTQHYLNITRATPPGWFYNPAAKPVGLTGWVPDALVPFNAKKGLGGGPFEIGANLNQGVWFDVYIPKEGMPAGVYAGTVKVSEGGNAVAELPVELRVLDFALPDENHFHAMIFFEEDQVGTRHGGGAGLVARYHRLAHRHRVEFTTAYSPVPDPQHLELLAGAAFTPEKGYVGPGAGVGYAIVPASFYGAGSAWKGAQGWKTADTFMTWLTNTKPDAVTFLYITDEPGPKQFPWIKEMGDHLHGNTGPGKALPMFVTKGPAPGLEGAIDIWCTVTNQLDLAKAKAEREKGRRWWVYNGHRPAAGTQITDAPAVDCRVTPWACWKHDVGLWFYWHANHWRHNQQSRQRGEQNVWVDPVTFGGEGGINGDGVLIYPGQDLKHPDQDRGIAGPVASIRLKNIRRGMQDYEYLWLAAKNGLEAEAQGTAAACVPRAFSEAQGGVAWSIKGSDWDAERWKLAEAVEKKLTK